MDKKSNKFDNQLQRDLLNIGVNINSNVDFNTPIILTNYIYFRLKKLIPQPVERRMKILQLLGASRFSSDAKVLPLNIIYKFDQQFCKLRETAHNKKTMNEFDKGTVDLSLESIPEPVVEEEDEPPKKIIRLSETPVVPPETSLKTSSTVLSTKLRRTQNQLSYYKNSARKLKETLKGSDTHKILEDYDELYQICEDQDKLVSDLKEKITKLEQEVRQRDSVIIELNEKLKIFVDKSVVDLKSKGKFTVAAQACFGQLITQCAVAHEKVPLTIKTVAELLKVNIVSLPSRWTVDRSLHIVHGLNCEYIAKVISECSHLSLLGDETTKFTRKMHSFALTGRNDTTLENFTVYLGVTLIPDKSAQRAFQALKEMVEGLVAMTGLCKTQYWKNFIIKIRNLVSDQASTQKLFNKILIEYRLFLLENDTNLTPQEKIALERVNVFFCRLHMLSNSTPHILTVLLEHEKIITENSGLTVPTVEWVIKKTAQLFGKRSSGKHSSAGLYETFSELKKLKFYKIDSFLGHRFNIFYIIAAEIVYNREHIIEFIESLGGEDPTFIQLKEALQNEMIILHLQVLALFDITICSRMWLLSENSQSVLETGSYAVALINYLKNLVEEPMSFFLGESPFDSFPASLPKHKKGIEFQAAFQQLNPSRGASEVVPLVATSLLNFFEKHLEPFLTGDYASPDLSMERETAGAPSTNCIVEASFAYMDYLTRKAPSMTTFNMSIKMTSVKNYLYNFTSSLPEEERQKLLQKAYSNMKLSKQLAIDKAKEMHRELVDKMEQKARELAVEKSKSQQKRHAIASKIEVCGFWRSIEVMETKLAKASLKDAKIWVKANLQYRKVVWQVGFEPKWLMQWSHKGHTFSHDELISNLKQLIIADPGREVAEEED